MEERFEVQEKRQEKVHKQLERILRQLEQVIEQQQHLPSQLKELKQDLNDKLNIPEQLKELKKDIEDKIQLLIILQNGDKHSGRLPLEESISFVKNTIQGKSVQVAPRVKVAPVIKAKAGPVIKVQQSCNPDITTPPPPPP